MSADLIRRAATLMRERAEAADTSALGWHEPSALRDEGFDPEDAQHIASWHPAVALAVADWLDLVANWGGPESECRWNQSDSHDFAALAVAHAYLGDDAFMEAGLLTPPPMPTCEACDDYGVLDGLEPCPDHRARAALTSYYDRVRRMTDDPAVLAAVDEAEASTPPASPTKAADQ